MVPAGKTFRIFVSSTFSDLKEERNALQRDVFPRLRELCTQHGCRFQAIDLRWGVSEEAGLDQRTMRICLEEIDRCQKLSPRPNFIVLLGDRYGWRPLPYEIPYDEYIAIEQRASEEDKKILRDWYRRDDNAVPPVYCLRPRAGEYASNDKWRPAESRLRTILTSAVPSVGLSPQARIKYFASATEQEIVSGALLVTDSGQHVFGYFRNITNTEELRKSTPTDVTARNFIDTADDPLNPAESLLWLKESLKKRLGNNVHEYSSRWESGRVTTVHLNKLCDDVYGDLSRVILAEIAGIDADGGIRQEMGVQDAFCRDKARFFTGRDVVLSRIDAYLRDGGDYPLVIHGQSGSGKTSVMARAVEMARERYPGSHIISRFIGASAESSEGFSLLQGIYRELSYRMYAEDDDFVMDYDLLLGEIQCLFEDCQDGEPVILFLDALDQLPSGDRVGNLLWLPENLPKNLRVVVSTIPGTGLSALEKRLPPANLLVLEPMGPADGMTLLDVWLRAYGRTLQAPQRDEVLKKFGENGLPLYLKFAFEEARRWKSYASPDDCLLPGDVPGIIGRMFTRLSAESNHGGVMVSRCLGYAGASKNGLSEDELLDLLSLDGDVMADFKRRSPSSPAVDRLPVVVWSRLFFDLEPYLMKRSVDGVSVLAFYHRYLGQEVARTYLSGDAERHMRLRIADYFAFKALDERKAGELPWQLFGAEEWERLRDCIADVGMLTLMVSSDKRYDLLRYWQALEGRYDMAGEYQKAFSRNSTLLLPEDVLKSSYGEAGSLLMLDARYDGARQFLQGAASLGRDPDKGSYDQVSLLVNTAKTCINKNNFAEAESFLRQAVAMGQKSQGGKNLETGLALNGMGELYYVQGKYDEAESFLRQALAVVESVSGKDHINTALILNNLAVLSMERKKVDEAEAYFRRTLAAFEKAYGTEHAEIAVFANNLAEVLKTKGDYAGAEPLFRRSLDIRIKSFGPENPETAMSYASLGSLLYCRGKGADALPLLEHALAIYEKSFGRDSPKAANILSNMATVLNVIGDHAKADRCIDRSIAIYEKVLGPKSPQALEVKRQKESMHRGTTAAAPEPKSFWKVWK